MADGIVRHPLGQGQGLLDGGLLAVFVDDLFVDGDEGGVVGHEVVFEAQFEYLLGGGVLVVVIIFGQIGEIFDALAGPEVAQGGVRRVGLEAREVVGLAEGFAAHLAGEGDGALGFALVFAEDEDGALGHHVGHGEGLDVVGLEGAGVELDAGEDGGADILAETLGLGSSLALLGDDHGFAAARKGHALDKPAVDTAADAEGEEVGLAAVLADEFEALALDGDVAIGEDDHGAGDVFIGARQGVGGVEGIEHFGATPLAGPFDEIHGAVDVLGRGIDGARTEHCRIAGEEDDVELVAGVEVGDKVTHQFLGDFHRETPHGAGDIDDEDVFAGRDVLLLHPFGGLNHEHEEVFVFALVEHEARLDGVAPQGVADNDVAIAAGGLGGVEADEGVPDIGGGDFHLV